MVPKIRNVFSPGSQAVMNWFWLRDCLKFWCLMPEPVYRVQNNYPVSHALHFISIAIQSNCTIFMHQRKEAVP
jgi:hypothetical protein